MRLHLLAFCAGLLISSCAHAANWPEWRGPTHDGIVPEGHYPLKWGPNENIAWKTPLPGGGNSTPIVWGNRVFVTCATEGGVKRSLICFDRADGKQLWQQTIEYPEKEPSHETNPYCSATPVTDGERVICSFGSAGVAAFDFSGKLLWHRKDLGALNHIWGNASSPVLDGDQVIQYIGPGLNVYLIAMDKKTGETLWKHGLPEAKTKTPDQYYGAWNIPIIASVESGGQTKRALILGLPKKVVALDLATRETMWFCEGLGPLVYSNPMVGKDAIVVLSGYSGPGLAVKTGGAGDITATHRLWLATDKKELPQRIGSGVVIGPNFYLMNESGVAQCTNMVTGIDLWREKVTGSVWSSTCAADGRLYVIDQKGETVVLEAGEQYKLLSRNPLNEPVRASLAFSDGQIFVRTYKSLYCIAAKE